MHPIYSVSNECRRGVEGSALLAVFWSVIVLTIAVSGWFFWLQQRVVQHGEDSRAAEALAMAHSGIAVALNPKVDRYSSLLEAELGPGMGYRVTIESEGGRLHLGWIMTGRDHKKILIFRQWLQDMIGMDAFGIDHLVDCLGDYIDADNIALPNGQEDSKDYHPANRMIQSLEELRRIPGMEPLLSYPGWQDYLTLESSGPLNLVEAPEEILRLLTQPNFGLGVTEARVQSFVQMRAGPDQIPHTEDDPKFNDNQVRSALGISQKKWEEWGKLFTVQEDTFRIRSEGYSGKVVRQVQVVVRKDIQKVQIRSWNE